MQGTCDPSRGLARHSTRKGERGEKEKEKRKKQIRLGQVSASMPAREILPHCVNRCLMMNGVSLQEEWRR